MQEFKIEEETGRLDTYLAKKLEYSRSKIVKMIKEEYIKVNGSPVKNSYQIHTGDIVTVKEYVEEQMNDEPEDMDLDIVYEDDDVIVVNKANGIVVHPAVGNTKGTLVNGLLYHSDSLSDVNGDFRPGIVHRIDAYTTGLLMVAKNNEAHNILAEEIKEKKAKRKYLALVWGVINNNSGTIDAPIGRDPNNRLKMKVTDINSKEAVTHFKVLKRFKRASLLEVSLETGRTHQIRCHMEYIGHPIVNDPVYGKRNLIDNTGQVLHAFELELVHPKTGEIMKFNAEIPECFNKILNMFEEE